MENVRYILQKHFPKTAWHISQPKDGQLRASYIAQNERQRVFIKCNVPIDALHRLGEIEVAPRVLASGICGGTPYVVQEYITGTYPDWRWFAHHLPFLASFMRRYHDDDQLTSLLLKTMTTNYDDHVALDMTTLETQFRSLDVDVIHIPEIASAFEKLKNQAQKLHPVKLVPVHPDPNTKNMLLVDTKLLLVDWDNLQLSDPMRDTGIILWWYVSPQQWPTFYQAYGLPTDEYLVDRIYWWAARTSFAVALWHAEQQFDCTAFLQDFLAAVNKGSNPHSVFK
jgi:aminoglycoside phosphotransferase (APT) family kinase protein